MPTCLTESAKKHALAIVLILAAAAPFSITTTDPALDDIISPDARLVELARGNGQRFSGPNDVAVAKDDAVYVTDNDFGLRDGGRNPDKQLQNGIYRIKDGKTTLVLSGADLGGTPGGIALSPDGTWMYLSTSGRIRRYGVNPDGTLGAFTVFTEGVGIGDDLRDERSVRRF